MCAANDVEWRLNGERADAVHPWVQTPDISGRLLALITARHEKKPRVPRPGDGWKVSGWSIVAMIALYAITDELHHQEWDSERRLLGVALPYVLLALCAALFMLAAGVHRSRSLRPSAGGSRTTRHVRVSCAPR